MTLTPSKPPIVITLPPTLTKEPDKYRHLYAAIEAVRLQHNTRAGDVSAKAIGFRAECRRMSTALIQHMLPLRKQVGTPGYKPTIDSDDPNHVLLKGAGKADYPTADLKAITGIDLSKMDAPGVLPPDPVQNFSGDWTEVEDGFDEIHLSATKAEAVHQNHTRTTYAYRDFGADHFGATFEHLFEHYVTDTTRYPALYYVTNTLNGWAQAYAAYDQAVGCYLSGGHNPKLMDLEDRSSDTGAALALTTLFYDSFERTGETAIEWRFYNDAPRTSLIDTLATAIATGRRYRYGIVISSYDTNVNTQSNYYVQNLDLQEAAPSGHVPYNLILGAA